MSVTKKNSTQRDPDAATARRLATELLAIADALEGRRVCSRLVEGGAGVGPGPYLEGASIPELERERRAHVARMAKARYGLDDPRPNVADNLHRDYTLWTLRHMGESMRALVKYPLGRGALAMPDRLGGVAVPYHGDERERELMFGAILGSTLSMLGSELPEYRKRLESQRDLIGRILESYLTNVGGRPGKSRPKIVEGRPELHAKLCKAMGWTESADSMRKASQRRKAKQRRNPKRVTD